MSDIGHNGGPGINDIQIPEMHYFKLFPSDFLNGFLHLSLELRGAYATALFSMYDRMGGFPYDEEKGRCPDARGQARLSSRPGRLDR